MARTPHQKAHSTCPWGATTWGACDKAADDFKADWDAMQQVLLAWKVADRGATKPYRKVDSEFAQLVRVIAGEQGDIMNGEGNPSQSSWAKRLRRAIERAKAGDLPAYNLYDLSR